MLRKVCFILLGSVLLLSACGKKETAENKKYEPVVNAHPKYFVIVHGEITPSLYGKINIGIQAVYTTRNKVCDKTYNKLEGVRGWRQKSEIFKPNGITEKGRYVYKIPLDKFKKGLCNWSVFRLNAYYGSQFLSTMMDFSPCGGDSVVCETMASEGVFKVKKYVTSIKNKIICTEDKSKGYICDGGFLNSFGSNLAVPDNKNYYLSEKYLLKRKAHDFN